MKDYSVMIDGRNFFDQPIKNDLKTYDNIKKIATGQADDYTKGNLLDCPYFKKYYKLIAIDLCKQQKLDADPKAIQQIYFTGNLDRVEDSKMFFIIAEAKIKMENVKIYNKKWNRRNFKSFIEFNWKF